MAWLQYGMRRLAPTGLAIFILPPASLFQGGRAGEIRRGLIEAGCVQAVVSLPPSLYPTTSIPVTLWVVGRPRQHAADLLLIDASQLGYKSRSRTGLSATDIAAIDDCYRTWRTRKQLFSTRGLRAVAVPIQHPGRQRRGPRTARWIQEPPEDPQQYLNRITTAVTTAGGECRVHASGLPSQHAHRS
jgi:type I restriction-modification system DNA methylase subunit